MHSAARSLIRRRVFGLPHPLFALLLALALLFSGPSAAVFAVPGDLDPTFDGDGKLTTDFGFGNDYAKALAIQSDGKLVVAGDALNGGSNDFALARYNTDGSLDTTFDGDGKLTTDFDSSTDVVAALAIQSDGKLVVAGYALNDGSNDFALARYNTDGSLDTTFDGDGKLTTDFGSGSDVVGALAIQSDGKLVVAGHFFNGSTYDFALARYNTDGSLDTTFDGDGKLTSNFGFGSHYANALAIQSDGKLVVAGDILNGSTHDFALARYNTDGSLDTTFDGDGKLTTDFGFGNDYAKALAIQSNGKLVVAGSARNDGRHDFALARYNTDGSLDTTFDGDGKLTTDFGSGNNKANALAIQSDGKLVVAGDILNGSTYDFALARYNTDGSLNTTFDGDGKLTTDFGSGSDFASALAIQSDGKLVVAGYARNSGSYDFALARYNGGAGNTAPTVSSITDQATNEDTPINGLNFTVSDAETAAGSLTVTGSSDNQALVPNANIIFDGNGASRTVTVTPAADQSGTATITVQVGDGSLNTSVTFVLTVNAVNDAPDFTIGANQAVASNAGAQTVAGWAGGFTPGLADEASQTLLAYQMVGNSYPALFAVAPTVAANGTLSYTPQPGTSGTATIEMLARDSGGTANGGIDTSPVKTFTIAVRSSYQLYLPLFQLR